MKLFSIATGISLMLVAAALSGAPRSAHAAEGACGAKIICYSGGGCSERGIPGNVGWVNGIGYVCETVADGQVGPVAPAKMGLVLTPAELTPNALKD